MNPAAPQPSSAPQGPVGTPIDQSEVSAAASVRERRPWALKHGDTFAVFDESGDIPCGVGASEGLYNRDTRYLSRLSLSIGDMRPMLLSSTVSDDNATLTCDLTNPDIYADGRLVLRRNLLHVRRSRFLWAGACFEQLTVRNFDERRRQVTVTLEFAADFADLFEVRGAARRRRGTMHNAEIAPDEVRFAYTGLDGIQRTTRLRFAPVPTQLEAGRAVFTFDLAPHRRSAVFIEIACNSPGVRDTPRERFLSGLRDARRALRASCSRAAAVTTSNQIFNEGIRRAVSDLYMLITDLPEGPYPYAGVPWFSTVFGRDALITALQSLWMDPAIARGVLAHLAATQAQEEDAATDAEPGKILHEARDGEMALLGEVPFHRYYGSVDSTPLFVMLAGAYLERTGDVGFIGTLWQNIEAALRWIDVYGDRDGDGFVEYGRRTEAGLANQGWKDSQDSVFHADGSPAPGPAALVEVQGYVYAAKRAGAGMARKLGRAERAARLDREAEILRRRFDAAFWDPELGTYVLALDRDKRPCRVRSSNAGHALFAGIALRQRAETVTQTLLSRHSFSGWGIRTVAAGERRYNPMSYHNGSVWPHDNALIAMGFARYGLARQAALVLEGLFEASRYTELRRLPELFCGFARQRGQGPTSYPVACAPQAWAGTAPLALLQSCLGLGFDPAGRTVTFDRPVLPDFLDQVSLRGLSLGGHSIDVVLRRAGGESAVEVLSSGGDIRVTTIS